MISIALLSLKSPEKATTSPLQKYAKFLSKISLNRKQRFLVDSNVKR